MPYASRIIQTLIQWGSKYGFLISVINTHTVSIACSLQTLNARQNNGLSAVIPKFESSSQKYNFEKPEIYTSRGNIVIPFSLFLSFSLLRF